MGAYLSQPNTEKISSDEANDLLAVGASSMQGWRNSQEDAHNSILNFDTNSSFFAVYDGHGGAEVATYCADKFPAFLKNLQNYKDGNIELALKDAFLGFDKTLLEAGVIEILKVLAGEKNCADNEDSDEMDDEDENLAELHEEGNLPLDEVIEKKYKGHLSMPVLNKIKDLKEANSAAQKPQSPYLRGRRAAAVAADNANRAVLDPDSKPAGSSTSAAAVAAMTSSNESGPSSSSSKAGKAQSKLTDDDSTVSSSSNSSSSKVNNSTNNQNDAEASAINSNGSVNTKEIEQNGNVTSSEAKPADVDVSTSNDKPLKFADSEVSGSNDLHANKQNGKSLSEDISSTSKPKAAKTEDDSTDDDADYDAEKSIADEVRRAILEYSSDDDEDGDEEDNDEAGDDDDDEEEADDEDDEEDIEEEGTYINDDFCANMIEEPGEDSGCTAVVTLLHGRDLYVANAGDSRCVVSRNGKAIEMSLDHKPEDFAETARIIRAGGNVTLDGRVNGGLNLSRAIGDHAYKMNADLPAEEQMISALPDIKKLIISPEDEFMILACDGIWNYMSSDEVIDFVRLRIKDNNKKLSQICEELFDNCLAPNTMGDGTGCDNMTAVIVRFQPNILKLSTQIDATQTEDVLSVQRVSKANAATPEAGEDDDCDIDEDMTEQKTTQKSLKRSTCSEDDDDNDVDSNEAAEANNTKRLKTEEEATISSTPITTFTSTKTTPSSAVPTDSSQNEVSASTSSSTAAIVQNECDSSLATTDTST